MIILEKVTKIYNAKKQNKYPALKNISLEISDGELCAIMGKSGSGKTTLLHIIGMLDDFNYGKYLFYDIDVASCSDSKLSKLRADKIGFVKQDFALIEDYSVIDNVMLPLYPIGSKNKRQKALKAIEKLGISELANKEASQLSGGEKQRAAIARAIVNDPPIILADEPTGSLDSKTARDIMDVFKQLNAEGKTVVIVTHDQEIAQRCDRIIEISDGEIVQRNSFRLSAQ